MGENKISGAEYFYQQFVKINNKLDELISQQKKQLNIQLNKNETVVNNSCSSLQGFTKLNVPSYIPDITGKQIYKLTKMGWNSNQICAITGYSIEEARKKYDTYVRNNV